MIRPKLSLRRSLAVAGAATLGLAASLAVAGPASAHHPEVTGTAYCDTETGNWNVSWEVTNSERDIPGKITAVALEPDGTLTAIVPGAELPRKGKGSLKDQYVVPGDQKSAKLTVTVEWQRGKQRVGPVARSAVVKFKGTCKAPESKPEVNFASDCEGVTVTLSNSNRATKAAEFVVKGENGFEEAATVAKGEDAVVRVPAENAANITVEESGKVVQTHSWALPEDCQKPEEPGDPAPPTGTYESTCDGLIFEISNPKDGAEVSATFTPNKGEAQTLTVAPGETKSVEFAAADGLTVTISAEGEEDVTVAWEQPEDCSTGGGGGLPVTGAQAGAIAGGAAVLLAVGVGLFLMARRRRITFTA